MFRIRSSGVVSLTACALALAGCSGSSDDAQGLRVIAPNGGELWHGGESQSVSWESGTRAPAVSIEFSSDDGATWSGLVEDIPDTGSVTVVVPSVRSPQCLVRVLDVASGVSDISDAPFEVVTEGIRVTSPNGDERLVVGDTATIAWTAAGVEAVSVEISRDGGSSWDEIAASVPAAAGSVQWTVEGGGPALPQNACLVRVRDVSGVEDPDESDDFFTVWEGTWTYPGRVVARPGRVYTIRFADPVDAAATGTVWRGGEIADTFLAPMFRRAVTMKADDLRTPIHRRFYSYFDAMAARGLPASGGLICESLLDARASNIDCLSRVDPALIELYHHGYDHSSGDGWSEFFGTGLDFQVDRLLTGAALARTTLGVELRAFGAPFNATDDDTIAALELAPAFEVIFYQPNVGGRITYSRDLEVEIEAGQVVDLDKFRGDYATFETNEILALQCHPTACDEENLAKLMTLADFLAGEADRRFTTPTAYARWLVDRDEISLKKIRTTRYELDFRDASYPQVLGFTVEPTSVVKK